MKRRKVKFFENKSPKQEEREMRKDSKKIISKIACKNYGFECSFMTKEDVVEKIIKEFREHAQQDHFIDYPDGILMKSLLSKN